MGTSKRLKTRHGKKAVSRYSVAEVKHIPAWEGGEGLLVTR